MRALLIGMTLVLSVGLGGCQETFSPFRAMAVDAAVPASNGNVPKENDELGRAKEDFRSRNFGLAETRFRAIVEQTPANAEAWLGLAATYDQLGRFDLADRSYGEAEKRTGRTAAFLNNRGYSQMMRGRFAQARSDFTAASTLEPENAFVRNNLAILDERQAQAPRSRR